MMNLDKKKMIKRAIWLSWFTIIYNVAEGLIAIYFGLEQDSVALAGFGGDSFIEVFSATLVLWRFKGETSEEKPSLSLEKERFATKAIGLLFLALAAVTVTGSGVRLYQMVGPDSTLPGLIVSTVSLSFMFFLWRAKMNVAKYLDSATVESDANCSLACIKLSFVLFLGSLIYFVTPALWWADSLAALVLAFYIAKEGIDMVRAASKEDFSGGCGCN